MLGDEGDSRGYRTQLGAGRWPGSEHRLLFMRTRLSPCSRESRDLHECVVKDTRGYVPISSHVLSSISNILEWQKWGASVLLRDLPF